MKKKTVIIYIIILVIVSSIVGMASYNIGTNSKSNNSNSSKKKETKIMTQEDLAQYITELPITTNNWKDYIELEDKEETSKNAFGEITNITKYTSLKMKNNNVYGYITIEYEIINKNMLRSPNYATQTATIYNAHDSMNYSNFFINDKNQDKSITEVTFTMNDIKCNRIIGKLYTINLPDNIWETDFEGNQIIKVKPSEKLIARGWSDSEYHIIHKDTYIKDLGRLVYYENAES